MTRHSKPKGIMYFTHYLRRLKYNKTYIGYALAVGLTSLVIPLGTQFLVNNLALAGIWANTVSFLVIIGIILAMSQIFRHTMVILLESLQREIFTRELNRWRDLTVTKNSPYYFEIHNMLKAFSKTYVDLIDLVLVSLFGLAVVVTFHPIFLILVFFLVILGYYVRKKFRDAYATSIEESNVKYDIYFKIASGCAPSTPMTFEYLEKRDLHFRHVRRISFWLSILHAGSMFFILAVGAWLIEIDQLSVGQLVASELIIAGIMSSAQKLPNALEALYDFETSHYKINKALRGHHAPE
jgi:hypothetical protein